MSRLFGRRKVLAFAAVGGVSLASGAALLLESAPAQPAANAPREVPLPNKPPAPRVAWVFSSGGPRAFVHVGVIRALAQMGLSPDLLVGASAGAWVAVLVAAGLGAPAIEQTALTLQPWHLLRPAWGSDERWVGNRLAAQVRQQLRGSALHQLPKPAVCAVQRLRDGAVLGFNHGDAGLAVQAATAIEGTIVPLSLHNESYADADLRMPLPVRLALLHGATQVLAVDASAHEDRAPPGAERWRDIDLRKRQLTAPDAALATVLLHPDSGYYAGLSREYREHCFAAGERSAWAARDALLAMHQRAVAA